MSLVEKIFVGIAIMLVQRYMPNLSNDRHASVPYFKWIFSFGCGGAFIFSMIIFAILMPQKIGRRYRIYLVFIIGLIFGKYLKCKFVNSTDEFYSTIPDANLVTRIKSIRYQNANLSVRRSIRCVAPNLFKYC